MSERALGPGYIQEKLKMKTSELSGAALDWAVAKCEGIELIDGCYNRLLVDGRMSIGQSMLSPYKPSTDWAQGGAIIEREMLTVTPAKHAGWQAFAWPKTRAIWGDTPLEAAMRCYVASKLGDEVEVPDEFMSRV